MITEAADPTLVLSLLIDDAEKLRVGGARAEALSVLSTVLQIAPENRDAQLRRARVLKELGDLAGAERALGEILARTPDDSAARVAYFLSRMEAGRLQRELEVLDTAVCRAPQIGEALFACCTELLRDLGALEHQTGAIVRLGPDWPVRVSPALLAAAEQVYVRLPRVLGSARVAGRDYSDQAKYMRSNGARLERLVDHVAERISAPAGAQVFDAGCGNGYLLGKLVDRFGVRASAQDHAASLRAIVEANVPGVHFEVGDLTTVRFPTAIFDVVLCTDVLQHFEQPAAVLSELLRIAKPTGVVLVSVPDGRRGPGPRDVSLFTPESLRALGEAALTREAAVGGEATVGRDGGERAGRERARSERGNTERAKRLAPVELHAGGLSLVIRA